MAQSSYFPFSFFQGKVVPTEKANVSIMTNALNYGTGVFGGIRGYKSHDGKSFAIFRLDDHLKRLLDSARMMHMKIPYDHEGLKKIVLDLVRKNKPTTDFYLRPLIYNSSFTLTPKLNNVTFDFSLYMIPLGEYLDVNKGLKVGVSSWHRIDDNMIPSRSKATGGYINSALARTEAELNGFDEAIFLDHHGHVSEGSAENLFLVREGVLITPAKSGEILEGVTRRTVIQLAKDLGITTEEREVDRTELYVADELFFSGTGVQVAWIALVDHRQVGNGKIGPITKKIQEVFFSVVRGKETKYSSWRTIL